MNNIWALTEEDRFKAAQKEGVRTEAEYAAWLDKKSDEYLKGVQERTKQDFLQRKQTFTQHNWNQLTRVCDNCGMKLTDFMPNVRVHHATKKVEYKCVPTV
jgi:hypothetical protein